jgi:hypothetical protein
VTGSVEHRRQRLAEAIAWCALQKLQNKPLESEEIKQQRALGERAANHAFAARQLEASSVFKWVTRKKVKTMMAEASQMLAEARLDEIRPLAGQLRALDMKPPEEFRAAGQTEEQRVAIVESVCEVRAARLRELGKYPGAEQIELAGGRVLRCAYDENVSDGAAGYDSKGFFDVECVPPWETWVCYRGELIAYVPKILCGLAQRGIEVDPVNCIRWVDKAFLYDAFGISEEPL